MLGALAGARPRPSAGLGPATFAGELGGLVLDQPPRVRPALGLGDLSSFCLIGGALDLEGLVGPRADADLGEPGGVDADHVGRQDRGCRRSSRPTSNWMTASRGSMPLQAAVAADPAGIAVVAAVAEVFVAGQPGPAGGGGGARRPARTGAGRRRRRCW